MAETFVIACIMQFGVQLHVITDTGTKFKSGLFSELSKLIGVFRLCVTAYYDQSNVLIVKAHRTLKTDIISLKSPDSQFYLLSFLNKQRR